MRSALADEFKIVDNHDLVHPTVKTIIWQSLDILIGIIPSLNKTIIILTLRLVARLKDNCVLASFIKTLVYEQTIVSVTGNKARSS